MTALAVFTMSDGTSTRTFTPLSKKDGVSLYVDLANPNPELRASVTLSVTQPKAAGSVGRVKGKVTLPFLALDGVTVKSAFVNIEAVIPKDMTSTDRSFLRILAKDVLGASAVQAAVNHFEDTY